jgi:hypothetical protein
MPHEERVQCVDKNQPLYEIILPLVERLKHGRSGPFNCHCLIPSWEIGYCVVINDTESSVISET